MVEKVVIIGAGFVGSTAAYALFIDGSAKEIVLLDIDKKKAKGEALDLIHGNMFTPYTKISYSDNYDVCEDADLIVITAGANQKPGETRLDLTQKNASILKSMISNIISVNSHAIIVMVTNPADVLTYLALKWSKFPKNRVFGTGTMLDTARFRHHLSELYEINPKSIHAYILGEHGDTSFPAWSSAQIAGIPIHDVKNIDNDQLLQAYEDTKNAAYEIINTKGATYFAIGLAITKLVRTILKDQHKVLPISCFIDDYYGISDVCLSVPCVVGKDGIREILHLPLDKKEQKLLQKSANAIRSYIDKLN